jgi:hypothetical protein
VNETEALERPPDLGGESLTGDASIRDSDAGIFAGVWFFDAVRRMWSKVVHDPS